MYVHRWVRWWASGYVSKNKKEKKEKELVESTSLSGWRFSGISVSNYNPLVRERGNRLKLEHIL